MSLRLVLCSCLLVAAACDLRSGDRREVARVQRKLQPKSPVHALKVILGNGAVRVAPSTDADVHVDMTVFLAASRPVPSSTSLEAHLAHGTSEDGKMTFADTHLMASDRDDWELRVTLLVPGTIDVEAVVTMGEVVIALPEANNVEARVDAGKVAVTARDVAGTCRVRCSQGQVEVDVSDQGPAGGLDVECANGMVQATLPTNVRGGFTLTADTGEVDAATRFGLTRERQGARAIAKGVVGDGGPHHRIAVNVGQITLR